MPMHLAQGALEKTLQHRVSLLRFEPLGQDTGVREVTEQHRDPLVLPLWQERAQPRLCGTLALLHRLALGVRHGLFHAARQTREMFLYRHNETIAPTT
jgi:hypothetical protein